MRKQLDFNKFTCRAGQNVAHSRTGLVKLASVPDALQWDIVGCCSPGLGRRMMNGRGLRHTIISDIT